jgi:hypothetical protein
MINIKRYTALKNKGRIALRRITKTPLLIVADIQERSLNDEGDVVSITRVEEVKRAEYVSGRQTAVDLVEEYRLFIADFDALRDAP